METTNDDSKTLLGFLRVYISSPHWGGKTLMLETPPISLSNAEWQDLASNVTASLLITRSAVGLPLVALSTESTNSEKYRTLTYTLADIPMN